MAQYQAVTHKTISRVYPLTALPLRDLDNSVPVQVSRNRPEVIGERRAQGMLSFAVRICVERRHPDTMLGGRASDSSIWWSGQSPQSLDQQRKSTHSAISPRFAIRIESKDFWVVAASAERVEAALLALRTAVGPRRDVVRRSAERVITNDQNRGSQGISQQSSRMLADSRIFLL